MSELVSTKESKEPTDLIRLEDSSGEVLAESNTLRILAERVLSELLGKPMDEQCDGKPEEAPVNRIIELVDRNAKLSGNLRRVSEILVRIGYITGGK